MDPLSDMLRGVRLTGAIFFEIEASEPWIAATPPGATIRSKVLPRSGHLIPYHVLMLGTCWAGTLDEPPVQLSAGDVIVFPHGDAHVLSSAPGMRGEPNMNMYRSYDEQLPFRVRMGRTSAEPSARFFCGYLGCDAKPFNPLLSALPRTLHVRAGDLGQIISLFEVFRAETQESRVGGETVLERISELMFVQVVRHYLRMAPSEQTNWLSGLRDPVVGAALAAIHRNPSHGWTLNSLAHEVGTSRSRLAERFTHLVGQSPMQYLLHWRMHLAANRLRESQDTVATVAESVGYGSEVAFSRAFKRIVQVSPSEWRTASG
jgi:AraC-like DNA-binding protein